MIHRVGAVGRDSHFENGAGAAPDDALDGDTDVGQVLSQPKVVDGEIDKIANPLWRDLHESAIGYWLLALAKSQVKSFFSPKLLQEPYVPLKEQLNIIHAIFQQREPVHAHAEGESRNFLRVIPVVFHELKHVGIDHATTQHFNPSCLLAGTARSVIRPAPPI